MQFKNYVGKRFGSLTVEHIYGYDNKNRMPIWLCRCDCGNYIQKRSCNLRESSSCKSCNKERAKRNIEYQRKINPKPYTKIKLVKSKRLHNIWSGMKRRCNNSNDKGYAGYGRRGIKVCDEWSDKKDGYWNFEKWSLANGYRDDLSIDRIDNDGNYEPSNCRWTNAKQQGNNTRFNVFLEYMGVRLTLKEWSEYLEVPYYVIFQRHKRGWDACDILTKPRRNYKKNPMELISIKKIKIEDIKPLSH